MVSNYLSSLLLCHWLLVGKGARRLLVGSSNSWRQLGLPASVGFHFPPPRGEPSLLLLVPHPPSLLTFKLLLICSCSFSKVKIRGFHPLEGSPSCWSYLTPHPVACTSTPNCCSNGKILGFNPPLLLLFSHDREIFVLLLTLWINKAGASALLLLLVSYLTL